MLNGRELLELIDSDLLEYSNEMDCAESDVAGWRALSNLLERVSMLRLQAERLRFRHQGHEEPIAATEAELRLIEQSLEARIAAARPDAAALSRALEIGDKAAKETELSSEVRTFLLKLKLLLVAEAGRAAISAGSPELDKLLKGFHPGEPDGRWSGPFTSSAIMLPAQGLKRIGVRRVILNMHYIDTATLKVLFGESLDQFPEAVTLDAENVVIDLDYITQDSDRVLLTLPRTRRIGADTRMLGLRLRNIIFEQRLDEE
jgi:hypothetical protein